MSEILQVEPTDAAAGLRERLLKLLHDFWVKREAPTQEEKTK